MAVEAEALWFAAFGERLRKARRAAGMTQATLAEKSGLVRSTIANMEAGRNGPSGYVLVRLIDVLDIEVPGVVRVEPGAELARRVIEQQAEIVRLRRMISRARGALADTGST